MATIVIDVPGMGRTLFSPVLAHALEPGDLIRLELAGNWRVTDSPTYGRNAEGQPCLFIGVATGFIGAVYGFEFGVNEPILRAVGARAGGVR